VLLKANLYVIEAYNRGYRVIDGELYGPTGKKRKPNIKITSDGYKFERFNICIRQNKNDYNRPSIPVHKLAAFQKFGEKSFEVDIQVRHLDGNSLNNKDYNLELGTPLDNSLDKKPEVRLQSSITASTYIRKFTDEEMEEIRKFHRGSYKETMETFSISSKGTLHRILNVKYVTKI